MTPIQFNEQTTVLAKDQPEYLPLPVHVVDEPERRVISCWRLSAIERMRVMLTGRLWLTQMTFGSALQPQKPQIERPFVAPRKPRRRWSGNDSHFGPFTWARGRDCSWRPWMLVITSGDDDSPGCCVRLQAFGHTLICELPPIIKPWQNPREKWDRHANEYGISINDGTVRIFLGPQTHDSSTTRYRHWSIPWMHWRVDREVSIGLDGSDHAVLECARLARDQRWEASRRLDAEAPSMTFQFLDVDGAQMTAKLRLERNEYLLGERRGWKWLSWFAPRRHYHRYHVEFSGETGSEKGSWKGGTTACSAAAQPGELHEAVFRRYCTEHRMTFLGVAAAGDSAP